MREEERAEKRKHLNRASKPAPHPLSLTPLAPSSTGQRLASAALWTLGTATVAGAGAAVAYVFGGVADYPVTVLSSGLAGGGGGGGAAPGADSGGANGGPAAAGGRGFVAKVGDFGFARVLGGGGDASVSTGTYGTVTHCPPELLTAGRLSKAADVYAFGVLCWECYTGRRPWEGERE